MADIDVNNLNTIQLKALQREIEETLQKLQEQNRERLAQLRAEVLAFFVETGYSEADLFARRPRVGRPRRAEKIEP